MHLISIRKLRADLAPYPDAVAPVQAWYSVVKSAVWSNLIDAQTVYPKAEAVENFTVFNIKGNSYRLIVSIDYETQVVYYKYFLTHSQYSKGNWKKDPYFKKNKSL